MRPRRCQSPAPDRAPLRSSAPAGRADADTVRHDLDRSADGHFGQEVECVAGHGELLLLGGSVELYPGGYDVIDPYDEPGRLIMCSPARCGTCQKVTWQGCGMHADAVLADVEPAQRCTCR